MIELNKERKERICRLLNVYYFYEDNYLENYEEEFEKWCGNIESFVNDVEEKSYKVGGRFVK